MSSIEKPASELGIPVEQSTVFDLWRLHPCGDYFLARGGNEISPPRHANLTLTNKCNLRCEICGSQKTLDLTKTQRHHMPYETFQAIAETLFPFLYEVELNSQGDPLLYPQINEVLEALNHHKCVFRIQHNGTLLADEVIERINNGYGTVSLSLDAVGPKLDEVRRGASWERAESGLNKLAATRNKKRVALWLYPTVTGRTVNTMIDLVRWAHEKGVDYVLFHDYDTVQGSCEAKPDLNEKERQLDLIRKFLAQENSALRVHDNDQPVFKSSIPGTRMESPSQLKARYSGGYNSPLDADHPNASRDRLCAVPWQSLDIGIDGQVCACCRSQYYPFGFITSPESFADMWFGENYNKLRQSLMREAPGSMPLTACAGCIKQCAPKAGEKAFSLAYSANVSSDPLAFSFKEERVRLALLFRERAGSPVFSARIPLGLNPTDYTLYEDDAPLGPVCEHGEIMAESHGRYGYKDNIIYFSASDDSEPLRNGRIYELRRNS